jgi:hypothetical protein
MSENLDDLLKRFRQHFPKLSLDVTLAGFVGDLQGRAVVRASVMSPDDKYYLSALGSACFTEEGVLEGDYVALAERRAIRSALTRLFLPYTFEEAVPGKEPPKEPKTALRSNSEPEEAIPSAEPEPVEPPVAEIEAYCAYWKNKTKALCENLGVAEKFLTTGAGFSELRTEFVPDVKTKNSFWQGKEWKLLHEAIKRASDMQEWDRLSDFLPGQEKADGGSES